MVNYRADRLDRVFAALSDPTRRAVLARLAHVDSLSITALAEPFDIKLPAVMKHLDVLDDVGLIRRTKTGRTVHVEIAPTALKPAMQWLQRYERFWSSSLDRLVVYAESLEALEALEPREAKAARKGR
ncbi:MAG TPA: metalloregulator ArsR/SmtB family transcription factor [Gemmatimonadaceae bacterium]|jgi:DNA-binding transcriptional ArsR family regulator